MLLRASGESSGQAVDPAAVADHGVASGVPDGAVLVALAEAVPGDDDAAMAVAREALIAQTDWATLVDAAAVAANFECMVRIADGTGIPVDGFMAELSAELRDELGINQFPGADRLG